jgi:pyruvate carboxylase
MSGLTSQQHPGSIAAALSGSQRDPSLDHNAMQALLHTGRVVLVAVKVGQW